MASPVVSWDFVRWSAGSVVLVDEAGDGLSAFDLGCWEGDGAGVVVGRELVAFLVGSVAVEVVGVVVEGLLGVAAVEQQDPVGALLPC
ncbi:hypothetical protein OG762_05835 [Streptomyces sp. NBC_01136]|uniref:hypothetical protein n=1 Tax=unclassified Streptomyces TaxID=2593676 RepID=UPI00324F0092|nr:hypothetical protein OG762_05835 [Streptomyces sp. NBC_01136]